MNNAATRDEQYVMTENQSNSNKDYEVNWIKLDYERQLTVWNKNKSTMW